MGRGRIDLLVRWPYEDEDGRRQWQREALELKVWRTGRPDPVEKGLAQLEAYLERLGLDHGVLVVFDRREEAEALPGRVAMEEGRTPGGGLPVRILRL